jgi:hypothetical protein
MQPETSQEWGQRLLYFPSERRFDYAHPSALTRLLLHRDALVLGADSYRDPETGDTVLCSRVLIERGFCCSLGCRHCPYVGGSRPTLLGIIPE